ncbi:hypothetical protein L1887_16705 [Cichorium endivia]|nr:hypothetical protein L1887_16705 [Cichorium endivia]
MVTRSSIKRKPFANITNVVRKPYPISPFSQSKRPGSSTASDSSIGSTQNPIHENHPLSSPLDQPLPSTPPSLTPAHLVGDEMAYTRRRSSGKTLSKVNTEVPFNQTSTQETRNNRKEGSVSLCSSTMEKVKHTGKGNQSSLQHDKNDTFLAPRCSLMQKIKDKRNTKNTMDTPLPHSTLKLTEKGKENAFQSSYPYSGNTNIHLPHSVMKKKDKGKSIAMENEKTKSETVMRSSRVDLPQKDEGKGVFTPVYHRTLKKDKVSSCPPLLKTAINRNQDDGAKDTFQSKLQTEPPPNKKTKRCSSKESVEEYVLPQDFVDQQRAYFKEIDDFELEVEEV